jgi:putative ABC transport system ATP-binding protein
MRKQIVVAAGLVLVAAAFVTLMVFDPSFSLVISGSTPAARQFPNGQFQGGQFQGNFSFQGVNGGSFRSGLSAFGSTFTTTYYRFSAYLVGLVGVVITSIGILIKTPSQTDNAEFRKKDGGENGSDSPPTDEDAVVSSTAAVAPFAGTEVASQPVSRRLGDGQGRHVVIRLDSVVKTYSGDGVATPALRGVSLDITEGEFIAIVGPSGSGKSTLMNMVGALDKPTSGKVLIDGVDISKLNDRELAALRNRKIGLIFQSFNLIHRMNTIQNVEFPLEARNVPHKERSQRALKAIQLVGLGDKSRRVPSKLSGGEQQRVAVARALVTEPQILLGDEPTGNLDTVNTKSITDLLHTLNKTVGKTVVVITHNMEVANEADRIIYIRDGRVERDECTTIGGVNQ